MHPAQQLAKRLKMIGKAEPEENAITSSFLRLDSLINGGFVPGRLYVLAGAAGVGKTTFITDVCSKLLFYVHQTEGIGIFNIDDRAERYCERMCSNFISVCYEPLLKGNVNFHERNLVVQLLESGAWRDL